jgi:hypothetical protein
MEDQAKQVDLKVSDANEPASASLNDTDGLIKKSISSPESDPSGQSAVHTLTHKAGVAKQCSTNWDEMKGSDCARRCDLCEFNVIDVASSQLPLAELALKKPKAEHKLYRRFDGRYVDGDCYKARLPYNMRYVTVAFVVGAIIALTGWGSRYFVFPGELGWAPFTAIAMSLCIAWYGTGLMLLLRHKPKLAITMIFLLPVPFGTIPIAAGWLILKPLIFVPLTIWMKKLGIAPVNQSDPMGSLYPFVVMIICMILIFVSPGMRFLRKRPATARPKTYQQS